MTIHWGLKTCARNWTVCIQFVFTSDPPHWIRRAAGFNLVLSVYYMFFSLKAVSTIDWHYITDRLQRFELTIFVCVLLKKPSPISDALGVSKHQMFIFGWTFLKLHGYICCNSPKYILWVKIIDFSFMPKIIRILSKDHVPWIYLATFLP